MGHAGCVSHLPARSSHHGAGAKLLVPARGPQSSEVLRHLPGARRRLSKGNTTGLSLAADRFAGSCASPGEGNYGPWPLARAWPKTLCSDHIVASLCRTLCRTERFLAMFDKERRRSERERFRTPFSGRALATFDKVASGSVESQKVGLHPTELSGEHPIASFLSPV